MGHMFLDCFCNVKNRNVECKHNIEGGTWPLVSCLHLYHFSRYVKLVEHQLEMHMGYDGKNEDVVNPNGKHQ
jgi:hypothetical protein